MSLFPLTVRGAVTRSSGSLIVGPVDLDWDGEGTCVVVGPNGSGKTTLLRLMHGIARLHEGEISWACDKDAARGAQCFVFQRPVMLRRSVGRIIAYPLRMRGVARAGAMNKSWLSHERAFASLT